MIIWLASYPRSGNTFLRIILHRLYGISTYSIYDDNDPVAQRVGPDLLGYRPKPNCRELMANGPDLFFTKTHKRRKGDDNPAIYLVRDGRDAVVSQAHLKLSEQRVDGNYTRAFHKYLREAIIRPYMREHPSSGTWGGNVLSWLAATNAPISMLRYEDLIVDPRESVSRAVSAVAPELVPLPDCDIPSFGELRGRDELFFRRGMVGSYRDEMPAELHELFWTQAENAQAMELLSYTK